MNIRICAECEGEYDLHSPEKRRAGGKIYHCPDCAVETTVKYIGVSAGEGKAANISILKFNSESDRATYLQFWQANSGLHKGKSCQLSRGLKSTPAISFSTKAEFVANRNHKGKA